MPSFCSICITNIKTENEYYMICTEECKHYFCLSCSGEWFYTHKKCPNCNSQVNRIIKIKNCCTYLKPKPVLIIDLQNIKFYSKEMFIYLIKNEPIRRNKDIILYKISYLFDLLGVL